jgi:hypothetical protein
MTDEQIKEIMALVEKYGAECWNDGRLKYGFQTDYATQQASDAIESALRAVPAIPEGWKLVPCVPTTAMIDAGWDEAYARLNTYALTKLWDAMLSASPQPVPVPAIPEGWTNRERLLGEALGKCILASGIVRKDIEGFSGPELLMFADDLHEMLSASPQAPQPATPKKPLFEDLIAQHPGLREELSAMDAINTEAKGPRSGPA